MNAYKIKTLLDRFYNGQTTEEEERELDRFFNSGDVPEEMGEERAFFNLLNADKPPVPDGLEQRLSRQIDGWNTIEKSSTRRARIISLRWIIGVAASILLIFSVTLFVNSHEDERNFAHQQDTYDNPEDAYAETQRALMKFSKFINKGLAEVDNVTNKDGKK